MAIAWLTIAVSITGLLAIPAFLMVIRLATNWKGLKDDIAEIKKTQTRLIGDVEKLANGMDKRIRWLETRVWREKRRPKPAPPSLPTCYQDGMCLLPDLTNRLVGCALQAQTDRKPGGSRNEQPEHRNLRNPLQ